MDARHDDLEHDEHDEAAEPNAGVMTKAELVDEVARVVQLTKKQAETIVNIVFDSIVDSLRAGQKIELRGFGSFRLRSRKSRTGRNPKTGEKVEVPSKKIPYFKPGKELKELINKALAEGGRRRRRRPSDGRENDECRIENREASERFRFCILHSAFCIHGNPLHSLEILLLDLPQERAAAGCIFCIAAASADPRETLTLFRSD